MGHTFNPGFATFELLAINLTLGYNMNDRLRSITGRAVDHWVVATGIRANDFSLDPKLKRGFPKLFELKENMPRDELLPMLNSGGRTGPSYVITAEMEFRRRARVAYDRGSADRIRHKNARNFAGPIPRAAQ